MRQREHRYTRKIKSLFLVLCEGETERTYVEMLKRVFRAAITVKTKISGNCINERLLRQYVQELGLGKDDSCEIFFMYDADIQNIVERLSKLNGRLILTNPCIELWFLLHVRNHTKALTSAQIVNSLKTAHQVWSTYEKGKLTPKQAELLTTGLEEAKGRAKLLQFGSNPSSNIFEFIEELEKAKMR